MERALTTREPELVALRRVAEDLAKQHRQKPTTTHLLAALAGGRDDAAQLLLDRRLDAEVLLKAARVTVDDASDALTRALSKARDLAGRSGARTEARSVHVLFALCQETGTAAHRALVQCGTDVTRLRTSAMQLAMGLAPPRRMPTSSSSSSSSTARSSGIVPVAKAAPAAPVKTLSSPAHKAPARTVAAPAPLKAAPPKAKRAAPKNHGTDRFSLDPKQFPLLCQLGQNLTQLAARGELDPVVGREAEIERALDVLAKRHANNACLVGAPGVGKTSVVRGLAARIADGDDVACFEDTILVSIEPSAMVAGTGVRGSLAERVGQLKAEIGRAEGRVILFFDEMHVLFGQDDEASSELRLALARGEIVCIGATTEQDYRKVVDSDPGLARCFTSIEVCELSPEEALLAIERVAPLFEKHHGCTYDENALAKAVTWSVRYLPSRALPDKAVQILDLAGARARRRGEKDVAPAHVAEVISELAGVPEERLLESDADRLLRLEELLGNRIVGHGHALERIAHVLRRNASGFRSRRPIGTFLLLGPTGVGKTETAKAIAECLFHSADAMTRLDLSEYAESHAISRLVGAPPGYVATTRAGSSRNRSAAARIR